MTLSAPDVSRHPRSAHESLRSLDQTSPSACRQVDQHSILFNFQRVFHLIADFHCQRDVLTCEA